jgi:hypothetical protein
VVLAAFVRRVFLADSPVTLLSFSPNILPIVAFIDGLVWALVFGIPGGLLGAIDAARAATAKRLPAPKRQQAARRHATAQAEPVEPPYQAFVRRVAWRVPITVAVLFVIDWLAFYRGRPMMTVAGLVPLAVANLAVVMVLTVLPQLARKRLPGLGSAIAFGLTVAAGITWIVGHNLDHNAYLASHLVSVTVAPGDQLPASSTSHMVVVPPDVATTKASQTMATGLAGQRNYSTYLTLGPATLQMVDGSMWYVFPLEFDGAGNKKRLGSVEPGYIMVSAENSNATPVERYDGQYSMIVSLGGGQGSEPDRWAYDHGYSGYLLDDPTLEIDDQGLPFYTITLLRPRLGWTFDAPVGVLVINAHTGAITRYGLDQVPSWVDRVYSQQMAYNIASWYGEYAQAGFQGLGSSNANRLQVSGAPVLVYTGTGHPSWRILLTSYNSDTAVSKIIELDAHTGAMRVYTPQQAMGIESTVSEALANASGVGASLIRANQYVPVNLTLHAIYGHLTWMASYETNGDNPSFVGVGFADAYHATANNVVFGSSLSVALSNYLTQLASESSANGSSPSAAGTYETMTGKIAAIGWDITGGQKYWYLTLAGDRTHVYVGTVSALGPALVLAQVGDPVTIKILNIGASQSTRTMESFTDSRAPLTGS